MGCAEQLSWMSRAAGIIRFPGSAIFHDGIVDGEELVHTGCQDDLLGLSFVAETLIEDAQERVPTSCGECAHVESGAYGGSATPGRALSSKSAAVAIEKCDTDQCCDLLAIESTEFGELSQQGQAQDPHRKRFGATGLAPARGDFGGGSRSGPCPSS